MESCTVLVEHHDGRMEVISWQPDPCSPGTRAHTTRVRAEAKRLRRPLSAEAIAG